MIHIDLDIVQQRLLHPPAEVRFVDWKAGRRYGKSVLAKALILERVVCGGQSCLYATPEASQFQKIHDFFKHQAQMKSRLENYGCKVQPTPHLTFRSGGYIEFRSLENIDANRSGEFDILIIDESQDLRCTYDEFTSVMHPMRLNRDGMMYFFGQFHGKNWQYKHYHLPGLPGKDRNPEYLSVVSPTHEAPFFQTDLGRRLLEADRKTVSDNVWRQEYLCEPLDSGSPVFRFVDRVVGDHIPDRRPRAKGCYLNFWDLGRVYDPPAFCTLEKYSGLVCVAEELALGTEFMEQRKYATKLARHFNAASAMDQTGAGSIDGLLSVARETIPDMQGVYFTDRTERDLVELAAVEIEQKRIAIPKEFDQLIHELNRFEFEQDERGRVTYHAPRGEHDDLAWSLIGTIHMRAQGWGREAGARPLSTLR